jgi:hypothetical protein
MKKLKLEGALNKWNDIIGSKTKLKTASDPCSLCDRYMKDTLSKATPANCTYCPLQQAGYGCLEEDSIWFEIDRYIDDNYYHTICLEDVYNNPRLNSKTHKGNEIIDLCKTMRDRIKELYDKE